MSPATAVLGIHPREIRTHVHIKTYIWAFIAALFVTTLNWKQPIYPSIGEHLNCGNPYQGILLSNKKESTIDTHNLDESSKNYAET